MALLAALVSCSDDPDEEVDPEPPRTSTTTDNSDTPDPEPPTDNPSFSLPRMPVGGGPNFSDDAEHPSTQCIDVVWNADPERGAVLKAGVRIEVTDFTFTPDAFELTDVGCGEDHPPCTGFAFTVDDPVCTLAVEPDAGAEVPVDPEVALTGRVSCELEPEECRAFADAADAEGKALRLLTPEVVPSDDTDLTETPSS